MDHLPPCCGSCPELDAGRRVCKLLGAPTLAARQRLLNMPCDARRLLRQRLRGHGEEIVGEALDAWLDADADADELVASYGDRPVDARLWLSGWPYERLAREALGRKLAAPSRASMPPVGGPPRLADIDARAAVASSPGALLDALAALRRIDPVGAAMVVELVRGGVDPAGWREALGTTEPHIAERWLLSAYRVLVIALDVLETIDPIPTRVALEARWFRPGDASDVRALAVTREALGRPDLSLSAWRSLYRAGVRASLVSLFEHPVWGGPVGAPLAASFGRVLRVDGSEAAA